MLLFIYLHNNFILYCKFYNTLFQSTLLFILFTSIYYNCLILCARKNSFIRVQYVMPYKPINSRVIQFNVNQVDIQPLFSPIIIRAEFQELTLWGILQFIHCSIPQSLIKAFFCQKLNLFYNYDCSALNLSLILLFIKLSLSRGLVTLIQFYYKIGPVCRSIQGYFIGGLNKNIFLWVFIYRVLSYI